MVPSSGSTLTCLKKFTSFNGSNTGPYSSAARSISPSLPSSNFTHTMKSRTYLASTTSINMIYSNGSMRRIVFVVVDHDHDSEKTANRRHFDDSTSRNADAGSAEIALHRLRFAEDTMKRNACHSIVVVIALACAP